MTIALSFAAACFASFTNFCTYKNSKSNPSCELFLLFFYLASLIPAVALADNLLHTPLNPIIICIGAVVGFLNALLMKLTTKAIQSGPSSLTFAFLNASSIFPALFLFFIFGPDFGFVITWKQVVGMGLVIAGLFIAAGKPDKFSFKWLLCTLGCFSVQMTILTLFHWRCLLFHPEMPTHTLIPATFSTTHDVWFMPSFFAAAALLQGFFVYKESKGLDKKSAFFGTFGGFANMGSTALLLYATLCASALEKSYLFPCFAVFVIIICSLWERYLYHTPIEVKAISFCALGIIVSTL